MRHIDDDYWRTFMRVARASSFRPSSGYALFEKHPRGTVSANLIERYASCMADNVTDMPSRTLAERLTAARSAKTARKAEEEHERQKRAAEIRRNVEKNVPRVVVMATRLSPRLNTAGTRNVVSVFASLLMGACRPRNSATRSRRVTYAHCTTTRKWLPSCLLLASSPSVSTLFVCTMRAVTSSFGQICTVMARRLCE